MLYDLSRDPAEQNDLALGQIDRTRSMLQSLGRWETRSPNPVFREPADWRSRHLGLYDCNYQMLQPE